MSTHAMLHNEGWFNDLMTTYMHRAEQAAIIHARFDNMYTADLDEWLWYSHHGCRDRVYGLYGQFLGPDDDIIAFFKRHMTVLVQNYAAFTMNMIMGKIAYHRAAIGDLGHTIAREHHIAAQQHMSTQQIDSQPPSEAEIMIKYRDIHRWCVFMLHNVITSRHHYIPL